jgi:Flp pilus assembly pilin Flp
MNKVKTLHGEKKMREKKNNRQKGYTLLEYCAGAAIIVTVLYTALNGLGDQLSSFLGNIGTWAVSHSPTNKTN